MFANLALASLMVALTVTVHFFGLVGLMRLLRWRGSRLRPHDTLIGQGAVILFVVFGIFAILTLEIWAYALAFLAIGALDGLEEALYFSTTNFASLGYGDLTLGPRWRLFGAIEAANGVFLFAWSTAFLLSATARLRMLEHDWLEPNPKERT